MPSYHHQWLYLWADTDGGTAEIFNGARTAAYLANPALAPGGVQIANVLDFGGCEAYAYDPPCDSDDAYIQFPGSAGNLITVPDAAALDIVGNLTLIADVALDDWTPAAARTLLGKWGAAGARSYKLEISATGFPILSWTTAGTTALTATATVGLGALAAGERRAIRADLNVSVLPGKSITFWTAETSAGPWTQLGAAVATAGSTTVFASTAPLTVGVNDTGFMTGKLYYAQVRNGQSGTTVPGGSVVATIDPNVIPTPGAVVFNATTGQVVTISRSGGTPLTIGIGPSFWEPLTFSTPATDNAPWYDAAYPESADGIGFFITEWTGLDSGHVSRPTAPSGPNRTSLGRISARERIMKFDVLVLGSSEEALEYMYRWLETTFMDICSGCSTDRMWIRRTCPQVGLDLWKGVTEIREVGLVEGFQWETEASNTGGCVVRRLTFSLAAGDPCMYLPATDVVGDPLDEANIATCLAAMTISTERPVCRPTCFETPSSCRTTFTFEVGGLGGQAPVLVAQNDSADYSLPMRIICYEDPLDIGLDPNPCGLPRLGELYVGTLPPYSILTWDVVAREVRYSDHTTGGDVGGAAFLQANDPPLRRNFTIPCGTAHIVIEPASACLTIAGGHYWYGDADLGVTPHFPDFDLSIGERLGCP